MEIQKKSDDRLERCIEDKMTNKAMIREFYKQKIKRDEKNNERMIQIANKEKVERKKIEELAAKEMEAKEKMEEINQVDKVSKPLFKDPK